MNEGNAEAQQANRDALDALLGNYNHELYQRWKTWLTAEQSLSKTWSDQDRVAVLQICFQVYGPMPPEQACQFLQGFQLANTYALRYGPLPDGDDHA